MIHSREDYNRIQDPRDLIPENEPVLLLRAQDELGCKAAAYYAELCKQVQLPHIANKIQEHADLMKAWPVKKTPDLPEPDPKHELNSLDLMRAMVLDL